METFGLVLVVLIIGVIAGLLVGVCIVEDEASEWEKQRERQLRTELEGLRAANRLNVAFWRAKEELEAEADRHREGGDRPW